MLAEKQAKPAAWRPAARAFPAEHGGHGNQGRNGINERDLSQWKAEEGTGAGTAMRGYAEMIQYFRPYVGVGLRPVPTFAGLQGTGRPLSLRVIRILEVSFKAAQSQHNRLRLLSSISSKPLFGLLAIT
mgnify:CR=1 FL=1